MVTTHTHTHTQEKQQEKNINSRTLIVVVDRLRAGRIKMMKEKFKRIGTGNSADFFTKIHREKEKS